MPTTPSITVHVVYADTQSEATIKFLDNAGVDYRFIIADELKVDYVDPDGNVHSWTGFRPDRLAEAVGSFAELDRHIGR